MADKYIYAVARIRALEMTLMSQAVIEQLWLTYYNDTLYAKGLITEEQRNRMRVQIKNRAVTGRGR